MRANAEVDREVVTKDGTTKMRVSTVVDRIEIESDSKGCIYDKKNLPPFNMLYVIFT